MSTWAGRWGMLAAACAVGAACCPATTAASPCSAVDRPSYELTGEQAAAAMRCLLNAERRSLGRRTLRVDRPLYAVAQEHADDQAVRGYRGHVTPEGDRLVDRLRNGIRLKGWRKRWEVAEALTWGTGAYSTPSALFESLLESPTHRRIVLDGRYRVAGVAVAAHAPAAAGEAPGAVVVIEVARLR